MSEPVIHPVPPSSVTPIWQRYSKAKRGMLWQRLWLSLFLFALLTWSWAGTEFQLMDLAAGAVNIAVFLYQDFFPPDLAVIPSFLGPALDTLFMSYTGVLLSIGFSLILGVLASKNLSFHPLLAFVSRALITFIRSIPAIAWGILLVVGLGLGPLAGTIALGISGVGILGKAYADVLEEVNEDQMEALRAAGASWFQIFGQAVWPQFKSGFVTWSLYKMDLNIREAAMLGVVGAGGIGYVLEGSISLFQYQEAATGIIMIFILIIMVEFTTTKLREHIL